MAAASLKPPRVGLVCSDCRHTPRNCVVTLLVTMRSPVNRRGIKKAPPVFCFSCISRLLRRRRLAELIYGIHSKLLLLVEHAFQSIRVSRVV